MTLFFALLSTAFTAWYVVVVAHYWLFVSYSKLSGWFYATAAWLTCICLLFVAVTAYTWAKVLQTGA